MFNFKDINKSGQITEQSYQVVDYNKNILVLVNQKNCTITPKFKNLDPEYPIRFGPNDKEPKYFKTINVRDGHIDEYFKLDILSEKLQNEIKKEIILRKLAND